MHDTIPLGCMDKGASDEVLLEGWCHGDLDAGEALFERYFHPLLRFFGSRVNDGVDDLIQTTLLACVEQRGDLSDVDTFRPYLFAIARNQLMSHLRSKARKGEIPVSVGGLFDTATTPSSVAARSERNQTLLLALRRLPLDCQIAIELSYWDQFSVAELGRVLNLSAGEAKSLLHKAKEKLRDEYASAERGFPSRDAGSMEGWLRDIRDFVDEELSSTLCSAGGDHRSSRSFAAATRLRS